MQLGIDVDGTTYLMNNSGSPLSFDGYQIALENKNLDPVGWRSIQDAAVAAPLDVIAALGAGALTFGEANPNEGNLAELNLAGVGTLQAGARFAIGKPFKDPSAPLDRDDEFNYRGPTGAFRGDIVYIPEPSTWLLATLAALGCAVIRRRRHGAHHAASGVQR